MNPSFSAIDFYDRLGIDQGGDERQIRRQYRLLARLFHPDVSGAEDAQERFLALQEAYETLSDPERRATYDQWLKTQEDAFPPLEMTMRLYPSALVRLAGRQRLYLLLDVKAREARLGQTAPLNVMLALDNSSSMRGARLYYIKEAARRIIDNLAPSDICSILTFNDRARVILPPGRETDRAVAYDAIDSIRASGGTELASGLRTGLQELLRNHSRSVISHLILLTDGRTYGDEPIALDLANKAGERKIGITALGLGTDWNDQFLDRVAQAADGSAHYIAEPAQAVELFQNQLQRLQRTFARDANLQLVPGEGIELLQAHEVAPGLRRLEERAGQITIGALPARPPVRLLLEFSVPQPTREAILLSHLTLRAQLIESGGRCEVERIAALELGAGEAEAPPDELFQAAQRVSVLQLQERAWATIDSGELELGARELKQLAARFLEIGEVDLAEATRREVEFIQQTGSLSADGRKAIKYGTRLLALPAPLEGEQ